MGITEVLERVAAVLPDEALVLERALSDQAVQLVALRREVGDLRGWMGLRPGECRITGTLVEVADGRAEECGV